MFITILILFHFPREPCVSWPILVEFHAWNLAALGGCDELSLGALIFHARILFVKALLKVPLAPLHVGGFSVSATVDNSTA